MDCCIVATYPKAKEYSQEAIASMQNILQVVSEMRNIRNTKQIAPKEALSLSIKNNSNTDYLSFALILNRLASIENLQLVNSVPENATQFMCANDECFVELGDVVDPAVEKEKMEKELVYLQGFLKSVDAKLSNERFVSNAKAEVIDNEKKKKADAEQKIAIIIERLKKM